MAVLVLEFVVEESVVLAIAVIDVEESILILEVGVKKSVVPSTAAVDDAVDAEELVTDFTVVSVRGPVDWEDDVGASVPEVVVVGNAVDVAVLVDSTVGEGEALLVWKVVSAKVAVGDAVDVAALVIASTEVGGEAVLILKIVVGKCIVLVTAIVEDTVDVSLLVDFPIVVDRKSVFVLEVVGETVVLAIAVVGEAGDAEELVDSTVVTGRVLVEWKVVVGASVLGTVIVSNAVDVAVLGFSKVVAGETLLL